MSTIGACMVRRPSCGRQKKVSLKQLCQFVDGEFASWNLPPEKRRKIRKHGSDQGLYNKMFHILRCHCEQNSPRGLGSFDSAEAALFLLESKAQVDQEDGQGLDFGVHTTSGTRLLDCLIARPKKFHSRC